MGFGCFVFYFCYVDIGKCGFSGFCVGGNDDVMLFMKGCV